MNYVRHIYVFLILCICTQLWSQNTESPSPGNQAESTNTMDKETIERKFREYEKRMESYDRTVKNLQDELKTLKERMENVEQDKRVEMLREEFQDSLEETESDVIQENTVGLLNRHLGKKIISISGYYNFSYIQDDKKESPGSFRMNEFTLFFQRQIYDFNLFVELAFEDAPIFEGEGDVVTGSGEIFVEQAWIEYMYHPMANLRVGIMLMPETWNLQHYPTTTYTVNSPLHISQIFPRDFIGIAFYGDTENLLGDNFGIAYQIYVSNGPAHNKGKKDDNEDKVIGGKVTLHLPSFEQFELFDVSTNLYYGRNEDKDYDWLWNIELMVEAMGVALHAEYAQGRRMFSDSSIATRRNYGGFFEAAYTFWDKYSVYSRYEIMDEDRRAKDHIKRIIAGVRYKILPEISIKCEYFHEWHSDSEMEDFNGFAVSISALL